MNVQDVRIYVFVFISFELQSRNIFFTDSSINQFIEIEPTHVTPVPSFLFKDGREVIS